MRMRCLGCLLVLVCWCTGTLKAQPIVYSDSSLTVVADSTADSTQVPVVVKQTPRGALRRALMVPGWGQIYNRQYYKLPFVYLGLAGITANALYQNHYYVLYRRAYQYRAWQDRVEANPDQYPVNPAEKYKKEYDQVSGKYGAVRADPLRASRDRRRRNRDLSYMGIGLFYGLSVLDAYVNAHLLNFDVGEDLSVLLTPGIGGVGLTLRHRIGSNVN